MVLENTTDLAKRERKVNSNQVYIRISAVLSSLYGGAKFYVFLKLLIEKKEDNSETLLSKNGEKNFELYFDYLTDMIQVW